jgi:membrane-bound lytic murein transglycosylase F
VSSRIWFRTVVVLAAVALAGCGGPPRHTGDVDSIREAGELRIAVRPGFFDVPQSGTSEVDETRLLTQLASRLGVRLRWVKCSRYDRVVETVVDGVADIGISRLSPASLLDRDLRPTTAIDWVEDVLVCARDSTLEGVEEIRGLTVHLYRSRVDDELRSFLVRYGLRVEEIPEEVPIEEVLKRVQLGRYSLTVVDSGLVHTARSMVRVRILARVSDRRALVWAVRGRNPELKLAIDHFLFAERVLSRTSRKSICRDLRDIRKAGVLRLVTRNSATTCTVDRGGLQGFEYDLALGFARSLGVRLELSIPPPDVDPMDWLEHGYGDLAALHQPVAPRDRGSFLVTASYRKVDLVSVVSVRANPPASVEALAGVRVAAARSVAELCRMFPLRAPMRAAAPGVGADGFNAMLEVARGNIPVAVVDEDAAKLEVANRADLMLGAVVLPEVELVWILNPSSPRLLNAANRYLREARKSGVVLQLVHNEFGSWQRYRRRTLLPTPEGALSPYDELLQWAGRQHDIDWRLLASLMYEESGFDPDAVGPGGSAGLLQFMPFTWRELGVEDPHDPTEAVEAGARYLRQLMDGFGNLSLPDRVAMAIASYNVGPRHVFDARQLVREMGLDPDQWQGSVETAMLLLDDPEVARRYSAGVCRCRRAVGYTRRILRRYAAYTEQFPPA